MERNSGAPASAAGAATSSTSASAAAPDVTTLSAAPVAASTAATRAPAAAAPAALTSSRASQSRKNRHVITDANHACCFRFQILHCATTDSRPVTTLYIPDPDVTHTCRPHVDVDFIHPAAERIFIDIISRCSSAQQAQDVLSNAALLADPNLKEHLSSILKKLKPSDIERFAVSRLLWVERAKAGATDLLRIASVLEGFRDVLKSTSRSSTSASSASTSRVAFLPHSRVRPGPFFGCERQRKYSRMAQCPESSAPKYAGSDTWSRSKNPPAAPLCGSLRIPSGPMLWYKCLTLPNTSASKKRYKPGRRRLAETVYPRKP